METLFKTKRIIRLSIKDWNHFITMLAITGAIRDTSKEKVYNELGLESLQNRRWYRTLSFLYKVIAIPFLSFWHDPQEKYISLNSRVR